MTGIKKVFLSFLLLIIFLLLASVLVIKIFFPSNLLKKYAGHKISYFTGGKTEIENISAGFNGFTLSGIKILSDNLRISVEKVIISPNLFPFPKKQVAFNNIVIIKPEIEIGKNFKNFNFKRKFPASGHTIVLSRLLVENGKIISPYFKMDNVNIDVKNALSAGSFPLKILFNISNAAVEINSDYNFRKNIFTIKDAVFKEDKKQVLLTGKIENLLNLDDMNFDLTVDGNGELFNRVFLFNLYKKKITVFNKENIKLTIQGNLTTFQVNSTPAYRSGAKN